MVPVDRDTSAEILRHRKACDLCLKEKCNKKCEHIKNYTYQQIERAYDEALACIEGRPSADVEKVRHGEWKRQKQGFYFLCSVCGKAAATKGNYCHSCGAKMDEENAE